MQVPDAANYEQWALSMCVLLDRIELLADDPDRVRDCCRKRFDLARQHGIKVEFGEQTSGEMH